MPRTSYLPNMVQAITVLTVLKMLTDAQTTCNNGVGRVVYERLPDQQLQGFDDDVVRDTSAPLRVLQRCQELCLRDRTAANNLVRTCTSFDFQPGSRIVTPQNPYNGPGGPSVAPEYGESTCYLTREQAHPDGIGNLVLVPNSVHFHEICLSSNRIERDCPHRRYVFERYPRKRLKLPPGNGVKEVIAANRTDCEEKCLNEFSLVCRSVTFDSGSRSCVMSRFTRRTHPEVFEDHPGTDYLENTCLNQERRCDGVTVFVKEENIKLGGPFEMEVFSNLTMDECQAQCLKAEKYFCRSVQYDEMTRQCILSDEDSQSQREQLRSTGGHLPPPPGAAPSRQFDNMRGVKSSQFLFDLVCLDSPRSNEVPGGENPVTSHLFSDRRPDTAFQRYRNSRLAGEFHSEITGRSLAECLDECLRQASFQCRSAVYSERFRTCRLSRFNQKDGYRIIYDADYDYYENLMNGGGNRPEGSGVGSINQLDTQRPAASQIGGGGYYPIGGGNSVGGGGSSFGGGYGGSSGGSFGGSSGGGGGYYGGAGGAPGGPAPGFGGGPGGFGGPGGPPGGGYGGSSFGSNNLGGGGYGGGAGGYGGGYDRYNYGGGGYVSGGGGYGGGGYGGAPGGYGGGSGGYGGGGGYYGGAGGYREGGGGAGYGSGGAGGYGGGLGGSGGSGGYGFGGASSGGFGAGGAGAGYGGGGRPPAPLPPPYKPVGGGFTGGSNYLGGGGGGGYGGAQGGGAPFGSGGAGAGYGGAGGHGGGFGGGHGGQDTFYGGAPFGPARPTKCDEGDAFRQVGVRMRMRQPYIRRFTNAQSLLMCERACMESHDFICRSFNYRAPSGYTDNNNCELSDRDSRELDANNPIFFEHTGESDFYERFGGRSGGECLDVSQVCNEDGMEFTLRTNEPFVGRIYTYGYYDRCFFRGNGGTVNVLRISGAQGYPDCGTQRLNSRTGYRYDNHHGGPLGGPYGPQQGPHPFGDMMTNIVVVQFSDYVQTGRDKRYNLTCLFRGPGEAVVTSGYIGAGSGSPIPIEYLPAENSLSSRVRLLILYQGRPTTTIAVGDPLTFRLEAQDGYNYAQDIFATNVIARDPYTGRSVQLIDRYGCPVDNFVFPGLDRSREGDGLEARFNAFKIPESNFLVFEATVRTCRDGCQPAYCAGGHAGRSDPSFGRRRRRDVNGTVTVDKSDAEAAATNGTDEEEHVREMIKVLETRSEMWRDDPAAAAAAVQQNAVARLPADTVCLTSGEYYGLISAVIIILVALLATACLAALAYKRYWGIQMKNGDADRTSPSSSNFTTCPRNHESLASRAAGSNFSFMIPSFSRKETSEDDTSSTAPVVTVNGSRPTFDDPSEPIYTDPSLFERSRSLRSIAASQAGVVRLNSHEERRS